MDLAAGRRGESDAGFGDLEREMGRDMKRERHTEKQRDIWAETGANPDGQRHVETWKCREKGRDTERNGERQIKGESDTETEKRHSREESERELLGDGQTGRKMERDMKSDRDRDRAEKRTDGGGRTREQVGTGPGPEFPDPRRLRVLSAASLFLGSRLRLFGLSDS